MFGFPAVYWDTKWTKTVNFGCDPFKPKCRILKDFSNIVCFYYWRQPTIKISTRSNNSWGSKSPKKPKRGHFIDGESIQKTWKIFNFTIAYATQMKLTMNTYLNKVFHLAKCWGVTHRLSEDVNENPLKMSQKINFLSKFYP